MTEQQLSVRPCAGQQLTSFELNVNGSGALFGPLQNGCPVLVTASFGKLNNNCRMSLL